MAAVGPQESLLIVLSLALRNQGQVASGWPALTRLAGRYGTRLDVTTADVDKIRDMTVGEFAAAVLAERREADG